MTVQTTRTRYFIETNVLGRWERPESSYDTYEQAATTMEIALRNTRYLIPKRIVEVTVVETARVVTRDPAVDREMMDRFNHADEKSHFSTKVD